MFLRNFSTKTKQKCLFYRFVQFETFEAAEDYVDKSTLKIGHHPKATKYNSRKLDNPSQRLKSGSEDTYMRRMEAKHRGFDEQNNTQYGYDGYKSTNFE